MLEFTGDLGELERSISALSGDASAIWDAGTQIDTTFRGLSSYYDAPEADQLFATTAPVATAANDFQRELETVAQALGAYASEVRPLVAKLDRLRDEAAAFRTRIAGKDDWHYDDTLTSENANRRAEMHATWEAFQNAERACANKIFALFTDFRLVPNDGKGDKPDKNEYGYSADMLNNAQGLPWGDKVEESIHWYELHRQIKHFVWDSFIVDGVWGTLRGIGTLFGVDGAAAAGQAWTNLGKVVTGLATTIMPGAALFAGAVGGDKTRRWIMDSQTALKDAGKAMISYDQWGKDNARAAGGATFNVLSTVLTGGAGAAAKTGAIARGISAASKVVHFVDPMTYVAKGATFTAVKVGDAMATLRNLSSGTYLDLANGSYKLADEPVRAADLPENSVLRAENSVKMTDLEGNTVYLNTETHLLHKADGSVIENADNVKREMSAEERYSQQEKSQPQSDREPAAVGGREAETGNNVHHAPATGHHGSVSSGGHGEVPPSGGSGHGGGSGGGGSDGAGGHGGSGSHFGDDAQPFERGGQTEQQIRDHLRGSGVKPADLERVLDNLTNNPAGREIAETIASGRHNNSYGYHQVVSSLSHPDKMMGGIEQLRLANRMYDAGLRDIAFEAKAGYELKPGVVTGEKTDLDVVARGSDGTTYGYQFKDVQNPKKLVNKIFSNMRQLTDSHADVQTFVVDTRGTLDDLAASGIPRRLTEVYGNRNVQFVIRVEDGTLMIPPGGKFMPGGMS
ncbi:hypothetical protein ACFQVC_04625 [Streptomyces monticola]|uniref:WXG100 family type VII secretion target n=1 Tax=Streptomyces monticola TaxID=2666263 RepID=A0ABW2JDL7_9ACTN